MSRIEDMSLFVDPRRKWHERDNPVIYCVSIQLQGMQECQNNHCMHWSLLWCGKAQTEITIADQRLRIEEVVC